jgi:hypothetical protein
MKRVIHLVWIWTNNLLHQLIKRLAEVVEAVDAAVVKGGVKFHDEIY